MGVGLTLAEHRGDAPCAIDANPDSGDLVERALGEGIYQNVIVVITDKGEASYRVDKDAIEEHLAASAVS